MYAALGMRLHFCLPVSGSVQVYIGWASYTLTFPLFRLRLSVVFRTLPGRNAP